MLQRQRSIERDKFLVDLRQHRFGKLPRPQVLVPPLREEDMALLPVRLFGHASWKGDSWLSRLPSWRPCRLKTWRSRH